MSRGKRFLINVGWNWAGIVVGLVIGFVISPLMIRRLGADAYGVWSLTFALVEYYWFFDLGFRSATTRYVAWYWTRGEPEGLRAAINTGLLYSTLMAVTIVVVVAALLPWATGFFKVPPGYVGSFRILVALMTVNWCTGIVFTVFTTCLEAVQRFDLTNRVNIVASTIRAAGTAAVLLTGHGLIEIGIVVVLSQLVACAGWYYYFRRVFEGQSLSFRYATKDMLKTMGRFGIHTFVATSSQQVLAQSAPLLIGHFLPTRFVGFYNLPGRLLQYTADIVMRIGQVTNTNAAELDARQESGALAKLAIFTSRYSLTIFMPLAIVLWTHGGRLFYFWVGREFAAQSAPLLPILVLGYVLGIVAQTNAGFLLQGLGRHQNYARGMLAEAILNVAAMVVVIPRYGIIGAAWATTILLLLNRGLFLPWVLTRVTRIGYAHYMISACGWPLLILVPVSALSWWLRLTLLPGSNLWQLLAVALVIGIVYYGLAFLLGVDREHRALLLDWIRARR